MLHAEGTESVTVPSHLLFDADYHRSGPDLVLTDDHGHELVITGYFSQPHPPALTTAEGATLSPDWVAKLAGPVAPAQFAQTGGGAQQHMVVVGKVDKASGTVEVQHPDGTRSTLQVGDVIYQGDVVSTKGDGSVGITFADSSAMSLGKSGRMVIDDLVFNPDAQGGHSSLAVLKGTFAYVSGHIAKSAPDAAQLKTPVMTIGIRGTSVAGEAGPEGAQNTVVLLQDPNGNVGQIEVTTGGGTLILSQANFGVSTNSFIQPPSQTSALTPAQIQNAYGAALDAHPAPPRPSEQPATTTPSQQPSGGTTPTTPTTPSNTGSQTNGGQQGSSSDSPSFLHTDPTQVVQTVTPPVATISTVTVPQQPSTTTTTTTGSGGTGSGTTDTDTNRHDGEVISGNNQNQQTPPSESGTAIDGYVANALVFRDVDGDGVLDTGEYSTTTNGGGTFTVQGSGGIIIVRGGTDTTTNQAPLFDLKAPAGSTVVTPLTTLMVAVSTDSSVGTAQAESLVKAMLGLSNTIALTTLDPIASFATLDGKAVLSATVTTVATINAVSKLLGTDASAVINALADIAGQGQFFSLTETGNLLTLINLVAQQAGTQTTNADALAVALASANQTVADQIAAAGSFSAVASQISAVTSPTGALADIAQLDLHDASVIAANITELKAAGIHALTMNTGSATLSAADAANIDFTLNGATVTVSDTGANLTSHMGEIDTDVSAIVVTSGVLQASAATLDSISSLLSKAGGSVTLLASGAIPASAAWWSLVDRISVGDNVTATIDAAHVASFANAITKSASGHLVAMLGNSDYSSLDLSAATDLQVAADSTAIINRAELAQFSGHITLTDNSAQLALSVVNGDNLTALNLDSVSTLLLAANSFATITLTQLNHFYLSGHLAASNGSEFDVVITADADLRATDYSNAPVRHVTISEGKVVDVAVSDLNLVGFTADHGGTLRVHLSGDLAATDLSLGNRFVVDDGASVSMDATQLLTWLQAGTITIATGADVTVTGDATILSGYQSFLSAYVDHLPTSANVPQLDPYAVAAVHDGSTFTINATDADGGTLYYTVETPNTFVGSIVALGNGQFKYVAPTNYPSDFTGVQNVTVKVSDGSHITEQTLQLLNTSAQGSPSVTVSMPETINATGESWTGIGLTLEGDSTAVVTVTLYLSSNGDGSMGALRLGSNGQDMVSWTTTGTVGAINQLLSDLQYQGPSGLSASATDYVHVVIYDGTKANVDSGLTAHDIVSITTTFTGSDSNWTTDGNWDHGQPGQFDHAVIDGTSSVSVAEGDSITTNSVVVGANATLMVGGTLSLTGASTITGSLDVEGNSSTAGISTSSTLALAGQSSFGGNSTLTTHGDTARAIITNGMISGYSAWNGHFEIADNGLLNLAQDAVWGLTGTLALADSTTLSSFGTIQIGGSGAMIGNATISGAGTLSFDTSSKLAFDIGTVGDTGAADHLTFTATTGATPSTDINNHIVVNVIDSAATAGTYELISGVHSIDGATFDLSDQSSQNVLVGIHFDGTSHAVIANVDSDHTYQSVDSAEVIFGAAAAANVISNIGTGDQVHGGSQNDTFTLVSSQFGSVDGGGNSADDGSDGDTVILTSLSDRTTYDLTDNRLSNIETLQIGNADAAMGDNVTASLNRSSVANLGSTSALKVVFGGHSGQDQLTLTDGDWSFQSDHGYRLIDATNNTVLGLAMTSGNQADTVLSITENNGQTTVVATYHASSEGSITTTAGLITVGALNHANTILNIGAGFQAYGGGGDDVFQVISDQVAHIDGGDDYDVVNFIRGSAATMTCQAGQFVNVEEIALQVGEAGNTDALTLTLADDGPTTISGIGSGDTIIGGAHNETFIVNSKDFTSINGGDGTDTIAVRDGDYDLTYDTGVLGSIEAASISSSSLDQQTRLFLDAASILSMVNTDAANPSTSVDYTVNISGSTPGNVLNLSGDWTISSYGSSISAAITGVDWQGESAAVNLTITNPNLDDPDTLIVAEDMGSDGLRVTASHFGHESDGTSQIVTYDIGGSGTTIVEGALGHSNVITGIGIDSWVFGGNQADTFTAENSSFTTLVGGAGDDILHLSGTNFALTGQKITGIENIVIDDDNDSTQAVTATMDSSTLLGDVGSGHTLSVSLAGNQQDTGSSANSISFTAGGGLNWSFATPADTDFITVNGLSDSNSSVSLRFSRSETTETLLGVHVADGSVVAEAYRELRNPDGVSPTGNVSYSAHDGVDYVFGAANVSNNVSGIGAGDVIYGGSAIDTFRANSMSFSLIDGGAGNDTLDLTGALGQESASVINFTDLAGEIKNIETINLGAYEHDVIMDTASVEKAVGQGGTLHLVGSILNFSMTDASSWTSSQNSEGYTVYTHADTHTQVTFASGN